MKIVLYLYEYELTFPCVWNFMYFPNVGEQVILYSFLSEEERKDIEHVMYADVASDIIKKPSRYKDYKNMSLLMVLRTTPCLIEGKTWDYINNEWVCYFKLKVA